MAEQYEARVSSQGVLSNNNTGLFSANNDYDGFEDLDDDFLDVYNLSPRQRLVHQLKKSQYKLRDFFQSLPLWKKLAVIAFGVIDIIVLLIILIFHGKILNKMVEISNDLKEVWYTPLLFFVLLFGVSFPPMIGFSLLSTSVGLIYGVSFTGWIILFLGSVTGSILAFALFKTVLRSQAEKLIRWNPKFEALASILQDNNSYWILALIRMCPFPYSLTNGAIASVSGVSLRNFSLASIITSPKLVMYLFIGSRLKNMGETDSTASRLFDLLSIILTAVVLSLTAWILYFRTKRRYLELQRQQSELTFDSIF